MASRMFNISCLDKNPLKEYEMFCQTQSQRQGNSVTFQESNHASGLYKELTCSTMYQKAQFC